LKLQKRIVKRIFGAGTAAVVIYFRILLKCIMNFKNRKLICRTIKEKITNIQNKLAEDTFGWTVQVQ
jgi:branched-chain amino acid aminotransferase